MLSHQQFLDECALGLAEYKTKQRYRISPYLRRNSPGARLYGIAYRLMRA